jgi:signal transduction histidine kinase
LQNQARLRRMASQLSLTQARERREIAKEIHDGIGQDLAAANLQLKMLARAGEDRAEIMGNIEQLVARAVERVRSVTFGLSPPTLFELGLIPAVERLVDDMRKHYNLHIDLHTPGYSKAILDEPKRVLAFRAIRELLMNVVKHAQAKNVFMSIRHQQPIVLVTVTDDGVGFVPNHEAPASFGLFSIREQLESIGGHLHVYSQLGQGTTIQMTIPDSATTGTEGT